jgi:hypothetical protein
VELVRAIALGDEEAFASLYRRYNSTLLGFLIRILNTPPEAEDVLQEVFVHVWQHAAESAVGVKSKPESVVDGRQTLATILLWVIIISRREKTPQLPARRQTRRVDVRLEQ